VKSFQRILTDFFIGVMIVIEKLIRINQTLIESYQPTHWFLAAGWKHYCPVFYWVLLIRLPCTGALHIFNCLLFKSHFRFIPLASFYGIKRKFFKNFP